ncbi:MAG: insecticidal delta-endotoxin Cry8Ea1 family protein [Propionibacteriaceae bacterium]
MTMTQPAPLSTRATGYSINANDASKTVVTTGLGMIPEVGELLSGLVDIFWPASKEDVWGEIRDQVEALINQKLSDLVAQETASDLAGLDKVLKVYVENAKPDSSPRLTSEYWTSARIAFENAMPHFITPGYEVLLLPLWAEAANMHLGLLRDGVLFGKNWGWNDSDHSTVLGDLQQTIKDYTSWAPRIFGLGMGPFLFATNYHACEPFRGANQYRQQLLTVLDTAERWPFFDPTAYPPPVSPDDLYLTREMYSQPMGTADDSGLFFLPLKPPTAPISQISVWSGSLIDGIQVAYPSGGGPDGVTQTARMGSMTGGALGVVQVRPENPIVSVAVWAGDALEGVQFTFKDGTTSPHFGGSGGTRLDFSYFDSDLKSGQVLSSLYVNGRSNFYGTADTLVCGFQYERPA